MHTSYGRGWWMDACWIVDRAQHTRMDNTCSGFFERSSQKSVDGRTAAAALLPLLVHHTMLMHNTTTSMHTVCLLYVLCLE